MESDILSDCAPLNHIIIPLWKEFKSIRLMRDPTRGGVATTLKEISESMKKDVELVEEDIGGSPGEECLRVLGLDHIPCQ